MKSVVNIAFIFAPQADGIPGIGTAEETRMTERLHENEAKAEELTRNWTSKWKESHKIIEVKQIYFAYSYHII